MESDTSGKKRRIDILLVLLVVAAFLWYGKFGGDNQQPALSAKPVDMTVATQSPLISGPSPERFASFSVPDDGPITREIECADVLYTVLVFRDGTDYRKSPREAVYNSANACKKGDLFKLEFNPGALGIPPGDYYLIVADQGISDSWYNPR